MNNSSSLKILTLNLQTGIGMTKGYWEYLIKGLEYVLPHGMKKLDEISEWIKVNDVDIVLLTEVDEGSLRTKYLSQTGYLSKKSGIPYSKFFLTHKVKVLANQGNAILSKYPVIETNSYRLPGTGEPRFLNMILIDANGKKIMAMVTHLTLSKKIRTLQILKIAEIVKTIKEPIFLSGDFNIIDEKELEPLQKVLTKLHSAPTFPSWKPKRTSDNVFISNKVIAEINNVIATPKFSDHLGILSKIDFN